jgi:hypothetical protein
MNHPSGTGGLEQRCGTEADLLRVGATVRRFACERSRTWRQNTSTSFVMISSVSAQRLAVQRCGRLQASATILRRCPGGDHIRCNAMNSAAIRSVGLSPSPPVARSATAALATIVRATPAFRTDALRWYC